jgi:hypothetical protein
MSCARLLVSYAVVLLAASGVSTDSDGGRRLLLPLIEPGTWWGREQFDVWHITALQRRAGDKDWKRADADASGRLTEDERVHYESCCTLPSTWASIQAAAFESGKWIQGLVGQKDFMECREKHGGDIGSPNQQCYVKPKHMSSEANTARRFSWKIDPDPVDELAAQLVELVQHGRGVPVVPFDELVKFSGFQRWIRAIQLGEAVANITAGAWWEPIDALEGDEANYLRDLADDIMVLRLKLQRSDTMHRLTHLMLQDHGGADGGVTAARNRDIGFDGMTLDKERMGALLDSGDLCLVMFYKGDCQACLQHAPHIDKVATILSKRKLGIKVARIDCAMDRNLGFCRDQFPDGIMVRSTYAWQT